MIQRYSLVMTSFGGRMLSATMEPQPQCGTHVTYDDHAAAIQARDLAIRELVGALRKYGIHTKTCQWERMYEVKPCTCGLDAILAKYSTETEGNHG